MVYRGRHAKRRLPDPVIPPLEFYLKQEVVDFYHRYKDRMYGSRSSGVSNEELCFWIYYDCN